MSDHDMVGVELSPGHTGYQEPPYSTQQPALQDPCPPSKRQAKKVYQTHSEKEEPRERASNLSWGRRVVVREAFLEEEKPELSLKR